MKTIFDYINDILFYKKGHLLSNVDDENQYNSYMINRWVSMYSPQMATSINYTSNKYYSIFETKRDQYLFLLKVLPRVKQYRINYIKKNSKQQKDDAAVIEFLSKQLEISKREINYYISSHKIDIEGLKKLC